MGAKYSREFIEAAVSGSFKAACIKDYAIKIGVPGRTLRRWRSMYSLGSLEKLLDKKEKTNKKVKMPSNKKIEVTPSLDNFENEYVYAPGLGFRKQKSKDNHTEILALKSKVAGLLNELDSILEG